MISRFKSIDPTPCHQSAHPQQHESTVAFTVQEGTEEEKSTLTVSEVTIRHLSRLKNSASEYIGKQVNAAVITVPTNFTDTQRSALMEAAKGAGIEVLQFIHEPVAAVVAYDARPEAVVTDKLVVVADLGGTRSDVTVIASRGGMYTILATAHDYELGGAQLDQVLIDHFAKEFIKKHKIDPREEARSLAKLKLEAEATKKALSIGTNASLSIESLANGIDFTSNVNRLRYELLSGKVFGSFTDLIKQAVQKAELDLLDIDEVCIFNFVSSFLKYMLTSCRSFSVVEHHILQRLLVLSSLYSLRPQLSLHQLPRRPPFTPPMWLSGVPPFRLLSLRNLKWLTSSNPHTQWSLLPLTLPRPLESSSFLLTRPIVYLGHF